MCSRIASDKAVILTILRALNGVYLYRQAYCVYILTSDIEMFVDVNMYECDDLISIPVTNEYILLYLSLLEYSSHHSCLHSSMCMSQIVRCFSTTSSNSHKDRVILPNHISQASNTDFQ